MDTYGKIREAVEMLQGNINRMRVTTNIKELEDMRDWAKRRINIIFECRKYWIMRSNKDEDV